MNSAGDYVSTMQPTYTKNTTCQPNVKYTQPISSSEIQDRLRNALTEYSENNPEPPSMKD